METKNKVFEIDIENLIRLVYNKVAIWNNKDISPGEKEEELKIVSQEIVETVLEFSFSQLKEAKTGFKISGKKSKWWKKNK